jgi:hypothetical protein
VRRRFLILAVALALVVPAMLTGGEGLPDLVRPAHAADRCRLITIYGKERSSVGLVQYRVKERVYWCSDGRRVTYARVYLAVTYTAPFWSVKSSESNGHWQYWNGVWHGSRYEWRQKTMEGCITNIGGCLKTKHPWIEVEMRANLAMTLNWNTKDLTITRVEI